MKLVDRLPRGPALALDDGHHAWSRDDLHAAIDDGCARLEARGIGRGDAFGWLGANSVSMLAALFACERRGARFVPLNWRLAAPELRAIAEHAGLRAWHADPGFDALDGLAFQPLPAVSAHDTAHDTAHDDLLLAYTSGTTGQPKGALHTAAAMGANIDAAIDAQGLAAATRTLAVLPLFHVGGLCIQVLPTLAAGGAVRLQPRFDADAWFDALQVWRPTTSLLVPATMRALIDHPRWANADLGTLAFVNSGSQIVPRAIIDAFHARGVPVCQVYGATETGPVSLVLRPAEAMANPGKAGRPALGVEVRLVDGELWVRGPNLARGYHRQPDAPAFADGWFRSGDLARCDDHGLYEIVGRRDDLIISGGENIHPAEIENLVNGWPGVAEAVVVGMPDPRWGEVPVLVVEPRPGVRVDVDALMASLDERLARFKRPRRVVLVPSLPRTALGKVKRAALLTELAAPAGAATSTAERLARLGIHVLPHGDHVVTNEFVNRTLDE